MCWWENEQRVINLIANPHGLIQKPDWTYRLIKNEIPFFSSDTYIEIMREHCHSTFWNLIDQWDSLSLGDVKPCHVEGGVKEIDHQVVDTLPEFGMALWEVAGVGIQLRNFPWKVSVPAHRIWASHQPSNLHCSLGKTLLPSFSDPDISRSRC